MRHLFLVALAACSTAPEPLVSSQAAPPPPLGLEVSALVPGFDGTITVRGLGPFEQAHVAMGFALGTGPCIPGAGGLCLGISQGTTYLGMTEADATGTAVYTLPVPATAPVGAQVAFQAIAVRGFGGAESFSSPAGLYTVVGNDLDGDGFNALSDCDDDDPLVYPGAEERCDGIDNDCDGQLEPDSPVLVDGVTPYDSIAAAVANVPDGGVVELCGGTHLVPDLLRVERPITIRGQGPGVTSLQGSRLGSSHIFVDAFDVVLEGFDAEHVTVDFKRLRSVLRNTAFTDVPSGLTSRLGVIALTTGNLGSPEALRIADTRIYDNDTTALFVTHPSAGRALGRPNVVLERVELSGNFTTSAGNALDMRAIDVDATDLVVWNNDSSWGAVAMDGDVIFQCTSCDFGTGTDDNSPRDIRMDGDLPNGSGPAFYDDFGDDETFTCSLAPAGFDDVGSCVR